MLLGSVMQVVASICLMVHYFGLQQFPLAQKKCPNWVGVSKKWIEHIHAVSVPPKRFLVPLVVQHINSKIQHCCIVLRMYSVGCWSRGMILALGVRGSVFKSWRSAMGWTVLYFLVSVLELCAIQLNLLNVSSQIYMNLYSVAATLFTWVQLLTGTSFTCCSS